MKSLLAILLLGLIWGNGLVSGACEGSMTEYDSYVPGFCFLYVQTPMNYADATAYCKDNVFDSYLIEVTSTERVNLIEDNFSPAVQKWTGLERIATVWLWQHSGTTSPIFWVPGDPENNDLKTCGATTASPPDQTETVSDTVCSFLRAFICEKEKPQDSTTPAPTTPAPTTPAPTTPAPTTAAPTTAAATTPAPTTAAPTTPDCVVGNPVVNNCDLLSKGNCSVPRGLGSFVLTYNCSGIEVACKRSCRSGLPAPAECEGIEDNDTCGIVAYTKCKDDPRGCGIGTYKQIWQCDSTTGAIQCPFLCCCEKCLSVAGVFPRFKTCDDWMASQPEGVCKQPDCDNGQDRYRNATAPFDCITVNLN